MKRNIFLLSMALTVGLTSLVAAQQNIKIGTAVKGSLRYYLPIYAAEEKGFAKEEGLQLDYVPFRGGPTLNAAIAAGHVNIGISMAGTIFQASGAGLDLVIVGSTVPKDTMYFWVRSGSRYQTVKDLKGATIGVHQLGSTSHAYGRMVVKAEGLEGQVRFVGVGGLAETIAAVRSGAVDSASGYSFANFGKLMVAGEVRTIANIHEYLPEEWVDHVIYAKKEFTRVQPATVKRIVRALVRAMNFLESNPDWSVKRIIAEEGISENQAKLSWRYRGNFSSDGKVTRKGLENLRTFLVEYGILTKEKAPRVEDVYDAEFTS